MIFRRVEEHLQKKRMGGDSLLMFMKTVLIMIGWAISYYFTMIQGWILGAFVLGFFHSHLGISIGHDATHGAYSKYVNLSLRKYDINAKEKAFIFGIKF